MINQIHSFDNLHVIGDRVLIKSLSESERTDSGLILPPGVREKEKIQQGFVVKVGPGYALPNPVEPDELWKNEHEEIQYLPLQIEEGDLAIFLKSSSFEVSFKKEKYFIVPQSAILLVERESQE